MCCNLSTQVLFGERPADVCLIPINTIGIIAVLASLVIGVALVIFGHFAPLSPAAQLGLCIGGALLPIVTWGIWRLVKAFCYARPEPTLDGKT